MIVTYERRSDFRCRTGPGDFPSHVSEESQIEQEDRDLILGMARREPLAMDVFYTRYNRIAFSLVYRIMSNREDAEDVLVEVFWQVWQQAARYDSSRGRPVAWLLAIARSRAIDRIRTNNRKTVKNEDTETPVDCSQSKADSDPFVLADTRRAVQIALETLPSQQRIPLELAYFQGMSHSEIALALGQPLGTIKDRIRNGMSHLKRGLQPYL
jgi:RNA polymerase sigma-70 factor, ECF subfamily